MGAESSRDRLEKVTRAAESNEKPVDAIQHSEQFFFLFIYLYSMAHGSDITHSKWVELSVVRGGHSDGVKA